MCIAQGLKELKTLDKRIRDAIRSDDVHVVIASIKGKPKVILSALQSTPPCTLHVVGDIMQRRNAV